MMRYLIREKVFRLGEDATILNEAGQPVFAVDGKILSLHDRLVVRDLAGNEVINVHLYWLRRTSVRKIGDLRQTTALPSYIAFTKRCLSPKNRAWASYCGEVAYERTRRGRSRDHQPPQVPPGLMQLRRKGERLGRSCDPRMGPAGIWADKESDGTDGRLMIRKKTSVTGRQERPVHLQCVWLLSCSVPFLHERMT